MDEAHSGGAGQYARRNFSAGCTVAFFRRLYRKAGGGCDGEGAGGADASGFNRDGSRGKLAEEKIAGVHAGYAFFGAIAATRGKSCVLPGRQAHGPSEKSGHIFCRSFSDVVRLVFYVPRRA